MKVRVWVTDVWDHLDLTVLPNQTFADVKVGGLAQALGARADPGAYEVKYRGALVTDEGQTLAAAAVPDGAPLIILPIHRRQVS